ncbi:MAG: N-acetylmuramic acid 6-phosphate etherase [Chloroflexi bacterium 13_1_40CM_4_68_4]|nr:MAG: N-acetylmuramic acid 6-phosphate etherase [Chloroflexi bacterium 13_1_40CM_4_68_4]
MTDLPPTELRNKRARDLDLLSTNDVLALMNDEDARVPVAVRACLDDIARAVDGIVERFHAGGRLLYVGAGTSGRLGVLDAAEAPPTFGVPPTMVVGLIAGGDEALRRSIEGAEDDADAAAKALDALGVAAKDAVVGISAGGRTPYVRGALSRAKAVGAYTIALTCNATAPMIEGVAVVIAPQVGPEVIAGSTRLKSGTAEKLVLNMLTTASMVRLNKTYGDLMVDLRAVNAKLRDRALRILGETTGADEKRGRAALEATDWALKPAILMVRAGIDRAEAERRLAVANGSLRRALGELPAFS